MSLYYHPVYYIVCIEVGLTNYSKRKKRNKTSSATTNFIIPIYASLYHTKSDDYCWLGFNIKAAEAEEIDSLWVLDRLLWPLKPQTPYRGTTDGTLPVSAQNVFDPIDLLTFAAANTNKISLGTSVIDMLSHNPIILARRFATLDVLSQGRVICGLGIGWSRDEYQACNIPFKYRGKRAIEFVEVLKKIWSDDIVEFKENFIIFQHQK